MSTRQAFLFSLTFFTWVYADTLTLIDGQTFIGHVKFIGPGDELGYLAVQCDSSTFEIKKAFSLRNDNGYFCFCDNLPIKRILNGKMQVFSRKWVWREVGGGPSGGIGDEQDIYFSIENGKLVNLNSFKGTAYILSTFQENPKALSLFNGHLFAQRTASILIVSGLGELLIGSYFTFFTKNNGSIGVPIICIGSVSIGCSIPIGYSAKSKLLESIGLFNNGSN